MVKCKKCGDFILDQFEICYECKNPTLVGKDILSSERGMLIKKSFDEFRLIVEDKRKIERLLGKSKDVPDSMTFVKSILKTGYNRKTHIFILFDFEDFFNEDSLYEVEFIKNSEDGFIIIKNENPISAIYYSSWNKRIEMRISSNWNSLAVPIKDKLVNKYLSLFFDLIVYFGWGRLWRICSNWFLSLNKIKKN